MKKKKNDIGIRSNVIRYDSIPENYIINKNILEIGMGKIETQLFSKYKEFFASANYLGLDINTPEKTILNHIKISIQDFEPNGKKFDTIIMFHVLEHIELKYWSAIIDKIKSMLSDNGIIIIETPYNESATFYYFKRHPHCPHVMFGINRLIFRESFREYDLKFKIIRHPFLFRNDDFSFSLRSIGRGIKRIITWHKFVRYNIRIEVSKSRS